MWRPGNPAVTGDGPMRASGPTGDPTRPVWGVGPGTLTGPGRCNICRAARACGPYDLSGR